MGFLTKIFGKNTAPATGKSVSHTSNIGSGSRIPAARSVESKSAAAAATSSASTAAHARNGVAVLDEHSSPSNTDAANSSQERVSGSPDDQAQSLRQAFLNDQDRPEHSGASPEQPASPQAPADNASDQSRVLSDVKAPRNKQELFEELQRNYRDVVNLIQKVDGHLDQQNRRSERIAQVAERMDALTGAIEQAGTVPEKIDELKQTIENALRTTEQGTAERTERVRQAVEQVGNALVASSDQQSKLTHTMAEFRQTIGDLSEATGQSSTAMRTLMDSVVERDKALAEELRITRSRVIISIGILGGLSLAAGIVAIVAITQG